MDVIFCILFLMAASYACLVRYSLNAFVRNDYLQKLEINRMFKTITDLEEENEALERELKCARKKDSDFSGTFGGYEQAQQQAYSQTTSDFSASDLKRLKYYLHPDKHSGKTNDLWIKLNELSK